MKTIKVTLAKTVVLVKEEILEVPDNINDTQLFDKATDIIYHNEKDWEQKELKNIEITFSNIDKQTN
jgi:hypothetical protein